MNRAGMKRGVYRRVGLKGSCGGGNAAEGRRYANLISGFNATGVRRGVIKVFVFCCGTARLSAEMFMVGKTTSWSAFVSSASVPSTLERD